MARMAGCSACRSPKSAVSACKGIPKAPQQADHRRYLQRALEKATESVSQGGFPAGSVLVRDGKIIAETTSLGNIQNDPTAHSDLAAIRHGCVALSAPAIPGTTLYSSLQPCLMCFGAAYWAGINAIFYACSKDKLSPEYYGGNYSPTKINGLMLNPIRMHHITELENDALSIVRQWELKNGLQ